MGPEANQILACLKKEGFENLYHFTSVENLPNISKRRGLYSKQLLESSGEWPCSNPGGNDLSHSLDRRNNNWNKVALNLTPHTPMVYHKKNEIHICFFVVSIEAAAWEGVVFTNTNAAKAGHQRGEGLSGLKLINFGMVRSSITPENEEWVRLVQAEVLVPDSIPLTFVSKVAFISEASWKEGERLWGNASHPDFVVDKEVFHNHPEDTDLLCGFPFVSQVILTDCQVGAGNAEKITSDVSCFRRKNTSTITAVIRLQALSGTKGKVEWSSGAEKETEFRKSDSWIWWSHVSVKDLPDGPCSLKVSLNNILWTTVDFEVLP
jgi:hypothetical protein